MTSVSPPAPASPGGVSSRNQARERHYRTARLASGLILMAFVAMHLANLALNLVSTGVADAGLEWLTGPWLTPAGTVLLYGAAAVISFWCCALSISSAP